LANELLIELPLLASILLEGQIDAELEDNAIIAIESMAKLKVC
jgi:hypothetical protein